MQERRIVVFPFVRFGDNMQIEINCCCPIKIPNITLTVFCKIDKLCVIVNCKCPRAFCGVESRSISAIGVHSEDGPLCTISPVEPADIIWVLSSNRMLE